MKLLSKGSEEAIGGYIDLGTGVQLAVPGPDGRDRVLEGVRGLRLPKEDPLRDGAAFRQLELGAEAATPRPGGNAGDVGGDGGGELARAG